MAPSTRWKENIDPDEAVRLEKYAEPSTLFKRKEMLKAPRAGLFVTLGWLTIFPQDPDSVPGRKLYDFIEKLSFDIWHAPVEFRPLGNVMRARRVAYKVSSKERQALSEPDGSERFE